MLIWVWKTYVKINTFGFLAHVFVNMEIFSEYYGWFTDVVWWSYRVIQWKNKFYWKESNLQNTEFLYFSCFFINYYSIIDSC